MLSPDVDNFLELLGFTREKLEKAVARGYPPLISYLTPILAAAGVTFLDPMAGGGTIPLESVAIGAKAVACDYNPVAYLLLRATVEFPARYGLELWRRLVREVHLLLEHVSSVLSPYYDDVEGYVVARQVKIGGKVVSLQSEVKLSRGVTVKLGEAGGRELLRSWMEQHRRVMRGDSELYHVVHRYVAVQTRNGFKPLGDRELKRLDRAYIDYLTRQLKLLQVELPRDNEVFSDLLPLERYVYLFNPRQALALDVLVSYVRNRVRELVESEGEFGAAVG
ncbi:MAG: hypothetical protein ACK4M3_05565, partial [Pyrobaculum sp.]